jgi:hypothetical protein
MIRYAQAAWLISIGNELEAWKALYIASRDHGEATAIHAATLERIHLQVTKSTKGGANRGYKKLKDWFLAEYAKDPSEKASKAAKRLAGKFQKPYGEPELKLSDYAAEKMSIDRMEKTFAGWIAESKK